MTDLKIKPDAELMKTALQLAYGKYEDEHQSGVELNQLADDVHSIYEVLPQTETPKSVAQSWARHLLVEALAWKLERLESLQHPESDEDLSQNDSIADTQHVFSKSA